MEALDPTLIAAVAAGCVLLVLLVVYLQFNDTRESNAMKRRLARVRSRAAGQQDSIEQLAKLRRDQGSARMRGIDSLVQRLLPHPAQFRARLVRTGRRISLGQYALVCVITGLSAMVVEMLLLKLPLSVAVLVGIAMGAGLPHFVVGFMIGMRKKKFLAEFPDAIDLIIRGLRSGLPVPESIRAVAREFEAPIGTEFSQVSDRLKLGQSMEDALWDAADRLGLPEFNFFVISLAVQRETGGNLAETLENLSEILRKRRQMQLKIKAMSSEAKASAIILGSLPFVMFAIMFVMNRSYVMDLLTDQRGWVMIGAGLTCLSAGVLIMAKMVRFDI